MYVTEFKVLRESRRDSTSKKGELKIKDSPTMLLKTKEEESEILTNATMFMKTNHLNL